MLLLVDDLQQLIANRQVIAIVGAGVSIGATRAETASWIGLLRDGIGRCESVGSPRPSAGWGDRQRAALDDGQLDELLAVASQIESRLGAPAGGEYRRWLRESVGGLRAADRSVLEALRDLEVPLATTNYDGLIEEVTQLPPVTWRDGARIQRVIRADEPGVLHLHGYWQEPESVVLGIRSYEQVLGDAHAQSVQSALALMESFLFVGCGSGLEDPNFGALLQWMRKVLAGAEYRHFRLCREDERDAIQQLHPPEERIFAVGFGATHNELAPFLRKLKPIVTATPTRPEAKVPALLPARPARIFGREQLLDALVATLLLDSPPPAAVLGGPGFGKSTLCLAALHEPRVAERYGERRWFIRCDAANTVEDVLKEIALVLGVPVGPSMGAQVSLALAAAPGLLVLDNFETPWEASPLATEDLLGQLSGISGLALIAAIRGQQRPYGPAWREPSLSVTPLGSEDSRKAFLAIAGEKHGADRHLPDLLGALDGIPLAIELLAHAAEAEPNLDGLWRRWQEERVTMLRRADGRTRVVNAAVSFELSIAGLRMTDEARRLLSLLAVLPDGIAHEDLPAVMLNHPDRAAATLRQVGLAFDETGRLRALAPIREHVAAAHPPALEALAPALAHYTGLARDLGDKMGQQGGEQALRRLAADTRNIEGMLSRALLLADPESAIQAVLKYSQFLWLSGLGTPDLLENARRIADARGDVRLAADCVKALGDIALARSDHDAARARFEQAQPLYDQVGSVLGAANCIKGLGDVALARSDYDTARAKYEEARPIYYRNGGVLGVANCISRLGDIALARFDYDIAQARFEEARPLYEQVGSGFGVANCIKGLGDIALARSDHDTARVLYEEAQPLYYQAGNVLGVANCIKGLGDIALARFDYDTARGRFEEAQPLYQQVGSVMNVAHCLKRLGDIAFARSDHDTAQTRFGEARPRYEQVGSVLGVADCIKGLGDIAFARSDHDTAQACFAEARPLYEQVGSVLGIANCIKGLGDIALARSDHDTAQTRFGEARPLYEQVGSVLGVANCISRLGDIAVARSDHGIAEARFEEAQKLYRQIGAVLGVANCIKGLGDIAVARSVHGIAEARFEEAQKLYRQVGSMLGVANSIRGLGDIALARSDRDVARARFEEAMALYEGLGDSYSVGNARWSLASVARTDAERQNHVAAAREAYLAIRREDLLQNLNAAFGT